MFDLLRTKSKKWSYHMNMQGRQSTKLIKTIFMVSSIKDATRTKYSLQSILEMHGVLWQFEEKR